MSHHEQAARCVGRNCTRAAPNTDDGLPPDNWIQTYDDAPDDGPTGWLCPDCQTDETIVEHMARNEQEAEIIEQTWRDIRVDEELGRPAGGRASDAMMGIPPPDD